MANHVSCNERGHVGRPPNVMRSKTPKSQRMTTGWFLTYRDVPEVIERWLAGLGVRDPERGARDLADLARRAGPDCLDLVGRIAVQLEAVLPRCPEPGMA